MDANLEEEMNHGICKVKPFVISDVKRRELEEESNEFNSNFLSLENSNLRIAGKSKVTVSNSGDETVSAWIF
jgi:hypothetical protein